MNNIDHLTTAWYSAVTLYLGIYVDASLCETTHLITPETKRAPVATSGRHQDICITVQKSDQNMTKIFFITKRVFDPDTDQMRALMRPADL